MKEPFIFNHTSQGKSPGYLPVSKRRSSIEIIHDILKAGEKGAGKTEIMYSANMSYKQTQRYLTYLIDKGFLRQIKMDGTVTAYQITESGRGLIRAIDTLAELLSPRQNG